jgi:hypothetical protein
MVPCLLLLYSRAPPLQREASSRLYTVIIAPTGQEWQGEYLPRPPRSLTPRGGIVSFYSRIRSAAAGYRVPRGRLRAGKGQNAMKNQKSDHQGSGNGLIC